jgi:hypothetical protein
MESRKSHPKGREIVEKSNLLKRKPMLWTVSTQEKTPKKEKWGARFAYADETIDFRRVLSRHPKNGRPPRTNQFLPFLSRTTLTSSTINKAQAVGTHRCVVKSGGMVVLMPSAQVVVMSDM